MLFKIIIFAILFILIGRFIVRYVLPIFRITMVTHDKLKQMQQHMEDMQGQQGRNGKKKSDPNRVKEGDYIDYEEVK